MESLSIVLLCLLVIILNCMINARTPGVSAFDNVKLVVENKSGDIKIMIIIDCVFQKIKRQF